MHPLVEFIDPYLICFYRITGYTFVDFLIGTFALASVAVIIGEFTLSLAFLAAKKRIDRTHEELVRYQNLSVDAIGAGDKAAYQAANKLANDAYGKSFFLQIALSAGFLWPIFIALAWMHERFSDVEFQVVLSDYSVGYLCMFGVMYAAAYLLFKKIKYKLPYFRSIQGVLETYRQTPSKLKSFEDLIPDATSRAKK